MILYHYTCEHAAPLIVASGMLHGHVHKMLIPQVGPLIWLTTDDTGERAANGLPPPKIHGCDKSIIRVTVDAADGVAHRWVTWSRHNVHLKRRQAVDTLVSGSLVASWWLIEGDHPYTAVEHHPPVWSQYTIPEETERR